MKRLLFAACAFLLASCASSGPSQYLVDMNRYQGQSEAQLVDDLGPPDKSYAIGGTTYLTYSKATQQIYGNGPNAAYGYNTFNRRYGLGVNQGFGETATVQTYRCDVFFALRNHIVTKIGHRGNAC